MFRKLLFMLSFFSCYSAYSADVDAYGCFEKMKDYCSKNNISDCSYSQLNKNVQMKNTVGTACYNILRKEEELVQKSEVYECMEYVKVTGCSYLDSMKDLPKEVLENTKILNNFLAQKQDQYERCMKGNADKIPARCREKLNL